MTAPASLTAEIRLWWPGDGLPGGLGEWFEALGPGEPERRTDEYTLAGSPALGIKRRGEGGPVEVKALVATMDLEGGPPARLWIKHEAAGLTLPEGPRIAAAKTRRIAMLARCEVELGSVRVDGAEMWTSLCFEAQATLEAPLHHLAHAWAHAGPPPGWDTGERASYPEWLEAHAS